MAKWMNFRKNTEWPLILPLSCPCFRNFHCEFVPESLTKKDYQNLGLKCPFRIRENCNVPPSTSGNSSILPGRDQPEQAVRGVQAIAFGVTQHRGIKLQQAGDSPISVSYHCSLPVSTTTPNFTAMYCHVLPVCLLYLCLSTTAAVWTVLVLNSVLPLCIVGVCVCELCFVLCVLLGGRQLQWWGARVTGPLVC